MKRTIRCIAFFGMTVFLFSCTKILETPSSTGLVDINTVFANTNNATSMLMSNYRSSLVAGWPPGIGQGHGCLGAFSGELSKGWAWHGSYVYSSTGPMPTPTGGDTKGGDALSVADFASFYPNIRANFIIIENIDRVPGMSLGMKITMKAEAMGLIAYTYLQMFKNYGGVPIVTHSFLPTDNAAIPRASLSATLDYIVQLCDNAVNGLPTSWAATSNGRLTQGAVMAIKAQALLFAARPLFNTGTPYISLGGKNDSLICMGNYDMKRWQDVIDATQNVLDWVTQNNLGVLYAGTPLNLVAGQINPFENVQNPTALADYGTATSTPSNAEIILAYHVDENSMGAYFNTSPYWTSARYNNQYSGLMRGYLTNYYKADGTEQSWPKAGDAAPRTATDYMTRFSQMEPRFLADFIGPGLNATNNPGDQNWTSTGWNGAMFNTGQPFPAGTFGHGCATQTKFYYHAGNRVWFEYPLFRVAELYLNLAEAYNELGDPTDALLNLNFIHNRAGLPSITETDQTKLRAIIQREWAVEFFNESKRYYDGRSWKLSNIGTGGMYGPQEEFQFTCTLPSGPSADLPTNMLTYWSSIVFTSYWNQKMYLEPFPLTETNKRIIIQNPGY